jgi:osmotically-inducible protein OsmY
VTLDATRAQVAGCPLLREDREIQADVVETLSQTGGFFQVPGIRSSVTAGVVRLTGNAPSSRIKQTAVSRALAVAGVLDVDDHSYEDSSLIGAVAQALMAEADTRAAHLSVTSRMGVIGLNGAVPSDAARERATALAGAVPGVVGVVNSAEVRRRADGAARAPQ